MINEKVDNFLNAPTDSIGFGDVSNCKIKDESFIYWEKNPLVN